MYVQQRADGQNSTEREGEHGLDWLLTLWFYRDPEVKKKKKVDILYFISVQKNIIRSF